MIKRIVIAGGGTGGHIFPALAIADALRRRIPDLDILFIGAKGKMEMEKVPQAGYRIEGLDIAGFRRGAVLPNLSLPWKILRSFARVRNIFRAFEPGAAIGVGGYSTFPVLRYAQVRGLPTFIHESNSLPGKSNILLGRRASRIFVAFPGMEQYFPADRIRITGNPIRPAILQQQPVAAEARRRFGLDPDRFTVFVTGGSQGAASINRAVAAGIDKLDPRSVQLIWQTGTGFAQEAAEIAKDKPHIHASAFVTNMGEAFAAADLVVSRAGAMALSELAALGKAAILVPLSTAAEDHQTVNARRLVEMDAAEMLTDADLGQSLWPAIQRLAADAGRRRRMESQIASLAVRDADNRIVDEIIGYLE